jgi:hypothetical protein
MIDDEKHNLSYGKIIVKKWIPHILWAILAVMGAYNSGNIKNYFSEETSFYNDRRAYWKDYTNHLSSLRLEVWQMSQLCDNNTMNRQDQKDAIIKSQFDIQRYKISFAKIAFNLGIYFPNTTTTDSKITEYIANLSPTCATATSQAQYLLDYERSIVDAMLPVVYGFNPKTSELKKVEKAIL